MSRKVLLYLIYIIFLISACDTTGTQSNGNSSASPQASTQTNMATGNFREFPLPQGSSGLMRPTIDHQGRVWFGEMGHNYLASFDPHTQHFQQIVPPRGAFGIMGIAAANDDTIWFAEQYANYIGHYFPASEQFKVYPLPTLNVPDPNKQNASMTLPSAPNDLVIDSHGRVWFTELNADAVGVIDPSTGLLKEYPLSSKRTVQTFDPYGITIDPQGQIWFTESSTANLGRLDPATGAIHYFKTEQPLMEIVSDTHGNTWSTTFSGGKLVRLTPASGTFTTYNTPHTGSGTGGLYGLITTANGDIWFTATAENAIARFDAATQHYTLYSIPTENSLPLGLVVGKDHIIWFTEAGSNKIGALQS